MLRFILFAFLATIPFAAHAQERDLIVITDMEPDDRIALELTAARLSSRVLMIGTTVKNSFRKAALVRDQLIETDLAKIPVVPGSGGEANDYVDIASSRAAREYSQEGQGILPDQLLEELKQPRLAKGSNQLQLALEKSLRAAFEKRQPIEFLMLAPPTDLIAVLDRHPELQSAIKHIHVMGGWVDVKNATTGETEKRSTYNVNMDAQASARLLQLDVPMTLYSSHIIKPNFAGGSVSRTSFPDVIDAIERSSAHELQVFRAAGKNWDTHLMEKIPSLKNVIGDNAGRQFTPADPLVVIGLMNPALVTSAVQADVTIDVSDLDPARGFKMSVTENPNSKVRLVTGIDPQVFASEMVKSIGITERKSTTYRSKQGSLSCSKLFGG